MKSSGLRGLVILSCIPLFITLTPSPGQERTQKKQTTRRSQRVRPMDEVQVASPDGKVKFFVGSNAERLTYWVTLDNKTVIEPSGLDLRMDGYLLSSGVVFQ